MNETKTRPAITNGEIASYVLLPQFLPRITNFLRSGFSSLALYIVTVFSALRILPSNHPYLRPENYGSYGLIKALAVGARNVQWDRKHVDQIAVYVLILAGVIALFIQLFILMGLVLTPTAYAGANLIAETDDWTFFFQPAVTEQDYALRFLDLVFGLPRSETGATVGGAASFFESCIGRPVQCRGYDGALLVPDPYPVWPMPIHEGFHSLIEFYNWGIVAIGFIVAFYYVVTLAAETTVHGTFWGQRANKVWVPVRAIFFAAMIMPFFHGFNLAQYITLNAGYYGTGMASNAWRNFMAVVADEQAGAADTLIATPSDYPSTVPLLKFMTIVKTCMYSEATVNKRSIDAYIVKEQMGATGNCTNFSGTSFTDAVNFTENQQSIVVRFGERARWSGSRHPPGSGLFNQVVPCATSPAPDEIQQKYRSESGFVLPYCGEITIDISGSGGLTYGWDMVERNYELLQEMWTDAFIDDVGANVARMKAGEIDDYVIPQNTLRTRKQYYENYMETTTQNAIAQLLTTNYFDVPATLSDCGWLCAALYYNRIAQANGDLSSMLFKMPTIKLWPDVMERVRAQLSMDNVNLPVRQIFDPILGGGRALVSLNANDLKIATTLQHIYQNIWSRDPLLSGDYSDGGTDSFRPTSTNMSGNVLIDAISQLMGINGMFDMRENTDIHPLAQLSLLGKGMVEATIRMFGGGIIGTLSTFGLDLEESLSEVSELVKGPLTSVLMTLGMITLTTGFILYYVLPFLPFIYFFFAASSWVKAIFEAMIGLPLWALAHLRIDGEGLPGEAGASGWFLILEILFRPLFILMGLIASVSIFMAMVKVLNELFDFIIANVGGFNTVDAIQKSKGVVPAGNPDPYTIDNYRGPIDQFFYTVIYAIIVYMIALSTFKLVDLIPNFILRWMGVAVKTFGEFGGDPAGEIMGKIGSGLTLVAVMGGGILGKMGNREGRNPTGGDDPDPA